MVTFRTVIHRFLQRLRLHFIKYRFFALSASSSPFGSLLLGISTGVTFR